MKKPIGWIVIADGRLVYWDKDGNWWRGGSTPRVKLVLFRSRKEIQAKRRKVMRGEPFWKPTWAATVPVYE